MSTTTSKKDQAQETMERARETVKETASNVTDKVKEAASNVGQAAGNVATTVGHKAEDVTASAGRSMQSFGEKVREKGPSSGFLGSATEKVASGLESAGEYLEEKKLSGM